MYCLGRIYLHTYVQLQSNWDYILKYKIYQLIMLNKIHMFAHVCTLDLSIDTWLSFLGIVRTATLRQCYRKNQLPSFLGVKWLKPLIAYLIFVLCSVFRSFTSHLKAGCRAIERRNKLFSAVNEYNTKIAMNSCFDITFLYRNCRSL
jgi:hypothetical protein